MQLPVTVRRQAFLAATFISLSLLGTSCRHRPDEAFLAMRTVEFVPAPPVFLAGPVGVLLTNTDGFSAHVLMTAPGEPHPVSGDLLSRGDELLFAPALKKSESKLWRLGTPTYLWNPAQDSGFLLSEALQGYAPVSSSTKVVAIHAAPPQAAPERFAGQACEVQEVSLETASGSNEVVRIWRTVSRHIPARITVLSGAEPMTLEFSQLRAEAAAAKLFQPPADFTRYTSAEAMMSEVSMREQSLKRKRSAPLGEMPPMPDAPRPMY